LEQTHIQRPFYRIEENVALVEKFLQVKSASSSLTLQDWDEAYKDVSSTLANLSKAIVEMMGRGTRALGRNSGSVAAAHMPEMYEQKGLDSLLKSLQQKFKHAFDFDYQTSGNEITLSFHPCGLCRVVEDAGEKVGDAVLCQLFHGYLAGLIGTYTGVNYQFTAPQTGNTCTVKLSEA
jgi:hypothetical protein